MKTRTATLWLCIVALGFQGCSKENVSDAPAEAPQLSTEAKAQALEKSAAGDAGHVVPAATEVISKTEVQAIDPAGTKPLDDAITCLSRTIYWEARGEDPASMEAIANVVMNRLGHEGYPDTICEVVRQGHEQGACQFSWWCDGRSDAAKEDDAYANAKEIARKALNRQLPDRTAGALYFHQRTVAPSWSKKFVKTAELGKFVFYKPRQDAAK